MTDTDYRKNLSRLIKKHSGDDFEIAKEIERDEVLLRKTVLIAKLAIINEGNLKDSKHFVKKYLSTLKQFDESLFKVICEFIKSSRFQEEKKKKSDYYKYSIKLIDIMISIGLEGTPEGLDLMYEKLQ